MIVLLPPPPIRMLLPLPPVMVLVPSPAANLRPRRRAAGEDVGKLRADQVVDDAVDGKRGVPGGNRLRLPLVEVEIDVHARGVVAEVQRVVAAGSDDRDGDGAGIELEVVVAAAAFQRDVLDRDQRRGQALAVTVAPERSNVLVPRGAEHGYLVVGRIGGPFDQDLLGNRGAGPAGSTTDTLFAWPAGKSTSTASDEVNVPLPRTALAMLS